MSRQDLTAEYVRTIFDYDPEVGSLRWRRRADRDPRWNGRFPGTVAGTPRSQDGYIQVQIDGVGRYYRAHMLIWLWMTGQWPPLGIDHWDTDPANNRWSNLRLATKSQNNANSRTRSNNKSGFKGVSWNKAAGKWVAQISGGKSRMLHLGFFTDPAEAHVAYVEAAKRLFGEFARAA